MANQVQLEILRALRESAKAGVRAAAKKKKAKKKNCGECPELKRRTAPGGYVISYNK